ncbi:MAG: TIGR03862 family flavoprotein [Opitutaceae bacterium]|nr:TIGR03862 family flavoprotein [Cytophagales bacterium]
MSSRKKVAIIGSGPSTLMLAATLDETIFDVVIYERNYAPGRKFLVAGDGGFNLTHSEPTDNLISRYTPADFLHSAISYFTNLDLRTWLSQIGIETFIGSSKRVFPVEGIKPIDVLNAILEVLRKKNVSIKTSHFWKGFNADNSLLFEFKNSQIAVKADYTIFALGGASWRKTGSDGEWAGLFLAKGINVLPFQPSNCALEVVWPESLKTKIEGKWIKNISVSYSNYNSIGEIVCTGFGLEGSPIYALSQLVRQEIIEKKECCLFLDFKPFSNIIQLQEILQQNQKSITECLKNKIKLGITEIELLKGFLSKEEFIDPKSLAYKIKNFPLTVTNSGPINEAISTVGGIDLNEVDGYFEFKKLKKHFAIGEMLDWEAPTGGYLLQGCFSMGYFLGSRLNSIEQ